jgi:hypothetical protein
MKLKDELLKIVSCFDKAEIDYALCGGLAVAFHDYPRRIKDIDILIRIESLEDAKKVTSILDGSATAMNALNRLKISKRARSTSSNSGRHGAVCVLPACRT